MRFTIHIDSENEACAPRMLPSMLKDVISKVSAGKDSGKVFDINGNSVGTFELRRAGRRYSHVR